MSDPYRFAQSPDGAGRHRGAVPAARGRYAVRAVLWVSIILGATANAVTSFGGFHPAISVGFGLLTVLCIILLVIHHLRHRK